MYSKVRIHLLLIWMGEICS
ncbi:hypothetical protein LINPERPRIM_LOCUS5851 [Linum perenne]